MGVKLFLFFRRGIFPRAAILSLFCAVFVDINAQKQNAVWVIRDTVGLDFETDPPTSFFVGYEAGDTTIFPCNAGMRTSACISDKNGDLFAYNSIVCQKDSMLQSWGNYSYVTEPALTRIYDKSRNLMENGDSIIAWAGGRFFAASCSERYYFFSLGGRKYNGASAEIQVMRLWRNAYLTIMDGEANLGLGKVTAKNVALCEENKHIFQPEILPVQHSNRKEWWILTHSLVGDTFFVFRVGESGLVSFHTQRIGCRHNPWNDSIPANGYCHACFYNPALTSSVSYGLNGRRILWSSPMGILDVFDFDPSTGELSNHLPVDQGPWTDAAGNFDDSLFEDERNYYCAAMSSDGTKLYVGTIEYNNPLGVCHLYQYDLNNPDPVSNKKDMFPSDTFYFYGGAPVQLSSVVKGKIYFLSYLSNIYDTTSYVYNAPVINQPDSLWPYCDFQLNPLIPEIQPDSGIPLDLNLPFFPAYAPSISDLYVSPAGADTSVCPNLPALLGKTNDADTSIYHPIFEWVPCAGLSCCDCERPLAFPEQTTQYTLRVVVEGGCEFFDSVTVAVENVVLPMLNDTSVCQGKSFVMPRGSGIYHWSPAVTETESSYIFTPLETTTYTLSYSESGNCFAVDSFRITVIPRYVSVGGFEASYPDTFETPPYVVRFSSLTLGADSSLFVWYFGDSTSAIGLGNPVHVYPDTGSYVVSFVMLPPPGYCGAAVYSDTVWVALRDTSGKDTTSRTPPLFEGGPGGVNRGGVRVYPNPAQDEVRIHSERMNCTLSLYDATGKQLMGDVQVFAGKETKLSTKHLPEGVYFVKFRGGLRTGYVALVVAR